MIDIEHRKISYRSFIFLFSFVSLFLSLNSFAGQQVESSIELSDFNPENISIELSPIIIQDISIEIEVNINEPNFDRSSTLPLKINGSDIIIYPENGKYIFQYVFKEKEELTISIGSFS